jgi:hypothetical protein
MASVRKRMNEYLMELEKTKLHIDNMQNSIKRLNESKNITDNVMYALFGEKYVLRERNGYCSCEPKELTETGYKYLREVNEDVELWIKDEKKSHKKPRSKKKTARKR